MEAKPNTEEYSKIFNEGKVLSDISIFPIDQFKMNTDEPKKQGKWEKAEEENPENLRKISDEVHMIYDTVQELDFSNQKVDYDKSKSKMEQQRKINREEFITRTKEEIWFIQENSTAMMMQQMEELGRKIDNLKETVEEKLEEQNRNWKELL